MSNRPRDMLTRAQIKHFMFSFNSQGVTTFHIQGPYDSDDQWVHIAPSKLEGRMMMIESPTGSQLGIELRSDGTIQVGGWDESGEWIELDLCSHAEYAGDGTLTGSSFPLNQYTRAEEGAAPAMKMPGDDR